jgi:hypothetical protein
MPTKGGLRSKKKHLNSDAQLTEAETTESALGATAAQILEFYLSTDGTGHLDLEQKKSLRQCSKKLKDAIDAKIFCSKVNLNEAHGLLKCNWPLKSLQLGIVFGRLPSDESLTVTLPSVFQKFTALEHLHLRGVNVELPESLGHLSALKKLRLEFYGFSRLPKCLGNLDALEELTIVVSSLETLPESLGNLNRLETISIFHCPPFSHFPTSLGRLKSLKKLVIREFSHLASMPESVDLLKLDSLTIDGCEGLEDSPELKRLIKRLDPSQVDVDF